MDKAPVFRFAPSPNGYLHLGHARSAWLNAEAAQASGGRLLLRIEDIDGGRSREEFVDAIVDDLHWLGLRWEEPVRRQSRHFADYRAALNVLQKKGLIYPCRCTRSDIARAVAEKEKNTGAAWPRDPDGAPLYPGTCRAVSPRDDAVAWRLDMTAALHSAGNDLFWCEAPPDAPSRHVAAAPQMWGDIVLARKDSPTSYHLAVVHDDALQGVTHVIRGADLFQATAIHCLLQALLGLSAPLYWHHALVMDAQGQKLSKSLKSTALRSLRQQGWTPERVRRAVLPSVD
ncbi:MAG: tRNA glutamyl-Q(34) synthetase GluQRS [Beijerinckiaceae bacterium]